MLHNERQNDIVEILYKKDRVSVSELAQTLYVSDMTIRRDLKELESRGIVKRYRGGAVLIRDDADMSISHRFFVNEKNKKALAKEAAEYVNDDMTVYIDSSSTCQYVVAHLVKFKNIKIVTNSIKALFLASKLQLKCFLIGGEYCNGDMCFVGSIAEQYARQFNIDVAFFSSGGLSADGVISDNNIEQTAIRKVIMTNTEKIIFLFDNDKLNKKFLYNVCHADDVDKVIAIK